TEKAGEAIASTFRRIMSGKQSARRSRFEQGLRAYHGEAYGEAARLLTAGLSTTRDVRERLAVSLLLSMCLFVNGSWRDSLSMLRRIEKRSRDEGFTEFRLAALFMGSSVNLKLGRLDDAELWIQEAQEVSLIERSDHGLMLVKQRRGLVGRDRGDYSAAERLVNEALEAAKALDDLPCQAMLLDNLGGIYWRRHLFEKAAEHISSSLAIERRLNHLGGQVDALANLGLVSIALEKWDEAETALNEALDLDRALGNTLGEAIVLANLAEVYTATGRYDDAESRLMQALDILRERPSPLHEGTIMRCIGNLELERGDSRAAINNYQAAADILRKSGDKFEEGRAQLSLGLEQGRAGDSVGAWEAFQRYLVLSEELGDWEGTAAALNYLGRIAAHGHNFHQAKDLLLESIRTYQ